MNSRALCSSILTCALSAGLAHGGLFSKDKSMPKELSVRTTAYTHTESDHIQYGKKNAIGTRLQYDKKYSSAAADWSKFPVGTKFKIDGIDKTFIIDDYGSALVGTETIYIYKPSRSAMNHWGVRHVDIKILEYGDFEKSREILEGRTKYSHVRQMLAGIKKDPGPEKQKRSNSPSKSPASAPDPVAPKMPDTPPAPVVEEAPPLQLAAASSTPPTPPTPKPATAPAPVQEYTAPSPSSRLPSPAPVSAPKSAPAPATPPSIAATTTPAAKPEPKPVPAAAPAVTEPAERKIRSFQPLELANVSVETPEPVEAAAPAPTPEPTDEAKFRKREFRPLSLAANG